LKKPLNVPNAGIKIVKILHSVREVSHSAREVSDATSEVLQLDLHAIEMAFDQRQSLLGWNNFILRVLRRSQTTNEMMILRVPSRTSKKFRDALSVARIANKEVIYPHRENNQRSEEGISDVLETDLCKKYNTRKGRKDDFRIYHTLESLDPALGRALRLAQSCSTFHSRSDWKSTFSLRRVRSPDGDAKKAWRSSRGILARGGMPRMPQHTRDRGCASAQVCEF
jgi:hypothetical protein